MKQQNWKNRKQAASFWHNQQGMTTVEATLIMAMIVWIVVACVMAALFLYDKCSIERAAAMGALKGSQAFTSSSSEIKQITEARVLELLDNSILLNADLTESVTVTTSKVTVTVSETTNWWTAEATSTKKIVDPVQFVRNCKRVGTIVNTVKNAISGNS